MQRALNILVVDEDATTHLLLKTMLSNHSITPVSSGEEALELAATAPDLIILDAKLSLGINGYETCKALRRNAATEKTPIIFLSSYSALADRMYAYGVGGTDYLSKPFDIADFQAKIDHYSQVILNREELNEQLHSSQQMLTTIQIGAAKLQSISRFIQISPFIQDSATLFRLFIKTAKEINLDGVLLLVSQSGEEMQATDGCISQFEREILEMRAGMGRIEMFGRDRGIFNWGQATLLCRKIGDMVDILAILLESIDATVKAIDGEKSLLQQVEALKNHNTQVQQKVIDACEQLNFNLKESILHLGLVSSIDIDDAEVLNDLFDQFTDQIYTELRGLTQNSDQIQALLEQQKQIPPQLQSLMEASLNEEDEEIELF